MCSSYSDLDSSILAVPAALTLAPTPTPAATSSSGSRRRKLWELEGRAFCPVVGVCLPIPVLRRIVNKIFHGHNLDTDYALHSGAVNQCASRTPLAEGIQRELDNRYKLAIHRAASIKTEADLRQWWREASQKDLAGPLWATLAHPRCGVELENEVLGEVHMLQHQAGVARYADHQRMQALLEQNTALTQDLASVQQRINQLHSDSAARTKLLQDQALQLRAEVISRDQQLIGLQQQIEALQGCAEELGWRSRLAQELAQQARQIQGLERALLLAQRDNERQSKLIEAQAAELKRLSPAALSCAPESHGNNRRSAPLEHCAVLCVGGRTANIPQYRDIIESAGARFAHHDGGEEESLTKLDTTLAAADLVICQTGCISHNAYWRVKDHCKRTGKQCLFVENPGSASLKRALSELKTSDPA